MIPQYNHDLITSVTLWLANRLENAGQAYINVTGALYPTQDSSVRGYVYSSPYRGWVYDTCVSGATILSGVTNTSGQFLTRASGVVFDWDRGRVVSPQNWGTLTGAYARKEVNVYFSSEEESDYVLEQVYNTNKNLQYPITGFSPAPGMGPRTLAAPMVMLTNSQGNNAPFALGGTDNTRSTIRAMVITNNNWLQEGVMSLCRDAAHSMIPCGSYADYPIAGSGDLKATSWSYCADFFDKYGCNNGLWVENVYEIKLNERVNMNTSFYLGVLEFDVSRIRQPR